MKRNLKKVLPTAIGLLVASQFVGAQNCPSSHPYVCGGACYTDANQASSAGCSGGSNSGGGSPAPAPAPAPAPSNNGDNCAGANPPQVESGRRTSETQSWCDTRCVTYVGNRSGCLNAAGTFVSNASVCSDPENSREAIIDIEFNLGIDIDDNFIDQSGYQGTPPSINPSISTSDARKYFRALLGTQKGDELTNALNTNGDGIIDRNEASAAKGADPRQVLTTGFGCGLSTDDVLAYIGLYIGDGAIDKYAGDLDQSVQNNMLEFTRSWQPGTDAQACQYRGGCNGSSPAPAPTPAPAPAPTPAPAPAPTPAPAPAPTPAPSNNFCPSSHPVYSSQCGRCFVNDLQARWSGCSTN